MAYLNALVDPTCKEVDDLIARQSGVEMKATRRAELLRDIYGQVACDPDEGGRPFRIGRHPSCPVCSSSSMRAWEAAQPALFVDMEVTPVTHSLWESLTEEEKFLRIGRCIMDARM
ncbi:hypothetical protein ABNK63_13150 [Rhodanobacter sp. IGA1.0]|uniref:Uncharacterized protein n=1 Tax=Rhodanobacter sp. IGA1.0 TaxID=3158582 RepID=A0AAU7QI18_9GAMM